jgi:glycosyltransferase 2 family protein
MRRHRVPHIVLGLASTTFFVWLFARDLPFEEFYSSLTRLSFRSLAAAIAFLVGGYAARVVRWWVMLRAEDPELQLRRCAWPLIAGVAVNNVLPFRAGDALRVLGFRRQLRASGSRVLGTLLLERAFDLLVLLFFLAVGLLLLPRGLLPPGAVRLAALTVGLGVVVVSIVLFTGPLLIRSVAAWGARRRWVEVRGWSRPILNGAGQIVGPLSLIRDPRRAGVLLGLSLVAWSLEGAVFAAVAVSMGLDLELITAWFAMAAGTLATMLPSSPGYIGTFDYVVRESVVVHGVPVGPASAFAVAVHAVLWLPLTAGGALYLVTRGRDLWPRRDAQLEPTEESRHA